MALSLNEIQNYLRGLSTTEAWRAAMKDIADYNRSMAQQERAIEQEASRTFRNQNFQRSLQQEQISGYGKNQRDLLSEREKAEEKQDQFRREAAEKSFGSVNDSLNQVDDQLAEATTTMEQERSARIRTTAASTVLGTLAKGEKLDVAGNPQHAASLSETIAKLEATTPYNLTMAANVSGLKNRRDRLNTASSQLLDEAVRYGADVSKLIAPRGSSVLGPPQASNGSGSGIPMPPKAKVAGGESKTETPAEFKGANTVEGFFPALGRNVGNAMSGFNTAVQDVMRPGAALAGNAYAEAFGGAQVPSFSAIYSPAELAARAAAQDRRRNTDWLGGELGMLNLNPAVSQTIYPPEFPVQQRAPIDAYDSVMMVPPGFMRLPNGKIVPELPTSIGDIAGENPFVPFYGPTRR